MLALPEGLFIAVRAEQPPETRTYGRSTRDAKYIDADPVTVIVDFEGEGTSAHEFTVSLSGSIRDGIVSRQNVFNSDWDAVWYRAVTEDETGWTVEMQMPWSVAPMRENAGGRRRIGVYVSRDVNALAQRYAFPDIDLRSPTFVADLHRIEVPAFASRMLAWIPYGSVTTDLLEGESDLRAGIDLLWRPTASQQLSATINPDFGQVESDDLVVNFSAIETFFTDKRPFFTQDQQLFDLRTTLDGRLVNTRRIGAAPDSGPEGQTDILAAAKYSVASSGWEFGAFGASEDDSSQAEGRDFLAVRVNRRADDWGIGYLGTFTDRPTLNRSATVHAIDAEFSPGSGWALRGQAVLSEVDDRSTAENDATGAGAWLAALYAPGARLEQNLYASWYDDDYNVNDLGFMERNDIRVLRSETFWHTRSYPDDYYRQSSFLFADANWQTTDDGRELPSWLELGTTVVYRDGSEFYLYGEAATSGIDDLTTRGGPAFNLDSQVELEIGYLTARTERWHTYLEFQVGQDGLDGFGTQFLLNPQYYVSPELSVELNFAYTDSPEWLIWQPDISRVTSYARRQLEVDVNANWYPSARSELRLKLQWIGLKAQAGEAFDIGVNGDLLPAAVAAPDFSLSDLGVQARFRYEFKPLSELYVVYTYGGSAFDEGQRSFSELFDDSIDGVIAHQFLVKLAWRF